MYQNQSLEVVVIEVYVRYPIKHFAHIKEYNTHFLPMVQYL